MPEEALAKTLENTIKTTRASLCYECGKCTSRCPISRFNPDYSPRRTVGRLMRGGAVELLEDTQLWTCLSCGACSLICPSDVDYVEFTKQFRATAGKDGCHGWCSHGGALHSLMRLMTDPSLQQNRLQWVGDGLETAEEGEYLYFVGCLPYFDAFFTELDTRALETAKGTVRILNALGIQPVLMKNERCCGHDLLWQGDEEGFRKLARFNLEEIKKTGAKKVIMSCAECTRTFKSDYVAHLGGLPFEVSHLAEFLAREVKPGDLLFKTLEETVTYQDPCRLGRHLNIYEEPREVMTSIPGVELREMAKNRKNAVCCGTSAWMNCDCHSKQIQIQRLRNAQETGARVLITSCPKCAIHFKCALLENGSLPTNAIEIKDLAVLLSEALKENQEEL